MEWPLQQAFAWFNGRTDFFIITCSDDQFKVQLKNQVIKIVTKMNKYLQEKINVWQCLDPQAVEFGPFLKGVTRLALSRTPEFNLTIPDRYQLLTFLNHCFNSIEVDYVHKQVRKFLSLPIWINLSETNRIFELSKLSERVQMAWSKVEEQDNKLGPEALMEKKFERKFMFEYVQQFLRILPGAVQDQSQDAMESDSEDGETELELNQDYTLYCQRFIEFMIDIESQLPLRRFFHALLDYKFFIEKCQLSDLARHRSASGHLFDQLVELLMLYHRYEIDLMSGDPIDNLGLLKMNEEKILSMQRILWSRYPHLRKFSTKSVNSINDSNTLYQIITSFQSKDELYEFMKDVNIIDDESLDQDDRENIPLLASILINRFRKYEPQIQKIKMIPLFPNESVIWDTNLVPDQYYNYESPLAIPKLNLQFLTMDDYLLKNFMLFKNESTYGIRKDIEDGIIRSKCRWTSEGCFATGPKQRMALILKEFSIIEVGKPRLGEDCPSKVRAKIVINMDYVRPEWRREWEQLRKHDTCFLVSFRKPQEVDEFGWPEGTFPSKNNVKYVRGCEIDCLIDSEGKIVDENLEEPKFSDNLRTYLVRLDCNQYRMDQKVSDGKHISIYQKFHLIIRRKPEQNNFKGVLETIRDLMDSKFVVPEWLRNLLIGFGDPSEAHHSSLRDQNSSLPVLDLLDTFLDYDHLVENFSKTKSNYSILPVVKDEILKPPFRIKFEDYEKKIIVMPYKKSLRGPYPIIDKRTNAIRFTPAQTEAIISGLQPGLTMVVGPPGTGKTDVAVQILSTLYHTYPNQRTLIVTHSNHALNQIFDKMVELSVEEHHLLRMGHGEESLMSNKDFSRQGRVKYVLAKRMELLIRVSKLARVLDLDPGSGFTCQSAEYFDSYEIKPRWNQFLKRTEALEEPKYVAEYFPFTKFFDDAPQPIFIGNSMGEDMDIAHGCYRYIRKIFDDLKGFRPFEIFSSSSDRSQYLLIREAKIIAMTCTYAGLRRRELVDLNFQFDNILMEETAQILEIETTIPLLLQNPENGVNRLKRWIMIGDHHQLPPIIQNSAFQNFSNMEQSLFARFIRLGFPAIELDAQGRARSSICDLYRWRYKNLSDLSHVYSQIEFRRANAGFLYDYQIINVEGSGEYTPSDDPYYYQNRDEATYLIALYKFMRKIGYPAERITVLTTYNGQKHLLRKMFEDECSDNPNLDKPYKITTVDKYQGQQNDYILLSLVRTKHIGHIRDVRRLVVAMSRARLGLYVFARVNMFCSCYELQNPMRLFLARPQKLYLLDGETYPTDRLLDQDSNQEASKVRAINNVEELLIPF